MNGREIGFSQGRQVERGRGLRPQSFQAPGKLSPLGGARLSLAWARGARAQLGELGPAQRLVTRIPLGTAEKQDFRPWFIMLTYLFMLAWLGVTAFTSLPVYMYFNLWTICRNTTLVEGANLCLDLRQFGIVTIGEEKKICTVSENFLRMCESTELNMTFHLFIVALAGAGAAVIAMVHYLMVLSANWAYVKDACRMQKYEDIKSKEEQELHDIHSTRSKERLNAYT
ncbi:PREDICTED: neuronal membrane glycoprotein M6-a isoform X3 [Propithecus coquereli]|uniref:neuronal membrane glycoprotein M6-a isoform X3 n=1 Tax=Propithecus coquereli TaxID=379532 RepID=UPI00063EE996|nr:PREDICTED: neuronal membrane glycoprotein M6-a isoform X3 [Propithecus coquereli]